MRGNIDCLGGHILLGSRNMGHSAPPLSIMKWKRAEERERGGGVRGSERESEGGVLLSERWRRRPLFDRAHYPL